MRLDRLLLAAAFVAATALTACNSARPNSGGGDPTCLRCHGGTDNTTGAPPRATNGATAVADMRVGSHTKHLAAGVACGTCHTVPDQVSFPGHMNGTDDLVFSALAKKNIPEGQQGSMWNATAGTCAVYCHGTGLNLGGGNLAPVWNAPPAGGLGCTSCHGSPPQTAPGVFLAPHTATTALTDCATCHGTSIENVDGVPTFKAGGTHLDGNKDVSISGCTACHGDGARTETVDLNRAAPPKDLLGNQASAKVGAHQAHLHVATLTDPARVTCATCHTVPDSLVHSTANLGDAKVVFTGLGAKAPGADFAGGTCSNVYCHGATISGGSNKTPVWSGGPSQAACGTCHGFPPPLPHTQSPTTAQQCNGCHAGTVNADGSINKLGHINGTVEAAGAPPHPVPFPPAEHGPLAKQGVTSCTPCHGADLNGGLAPSCTACHTANGHPTWQTECTFCHGSATRTADAGFTLVGNPPLASNLAGPPLAANGRPVGAHEAHFSNDPSTGNLTSATIRCEECHGTLPGDFISHMNGSVAVAWGPLASLDGAVTPAPAPVAGQLPAASDTAQGPTCTNYCHGATLVGGTNKAPSWTGAAAAAACGTCHAVPQPYTAAAGWHVQNTDCARCHGAGYAVAGISVAARATHVDGQLTLGALTCTSCHGTAGAGNEAPPIATDGAVTGVKVGAHQAHLNGGTLRSPGLACVDCHGAKPTSTSHANGVIEAGWSPLAATGTTPTPAAFNAAWEGAPTCANYCHGATLAGGSNKTPSWTGGAAQAACGTCHATPLPYTAAGNWHVQNSDCARCHGTGYATSGITGAALASHVDGQTTIGALTCTSCHGTAAAGNEAPPIATNGAATGVKVGAHQPHLTGTTLRTAALACADCHGAKPASFTHANGVIEVGWSTLAAAGTTPSPAAFNAAWEGTPTCANYCHGATLAGGTASPPSWTGGASQAACGACHGIPLPYTAAGGWHVQNTDCNKCHTGYTSSSVAGAKANHINGAVNVINLTCTTCHTISAPFTATNAATASSDPRVGAHNKHLQTTVGLKLGCTDCHDFPGTVKHMTGAVDIVWPTRASAGGAVPTPAAGTVPTGSAVTCSNYCHGQTLTGGTARTPAWTGAALACTGCHGAPPNTGQHDKHVNGEGFSCSTCHVSVTGTASNTTITGPNSHVDGIRTVQLQNGGTWNATGRTCASSCHGTGQGSW